MINKNMTSPFHHRQQHYSLGKRPQKCVQVITIHFFGHIIPRIPKWGCGRWRRAVPYTGIYGRRLNFIARNPTDYTDVLVQITTVPRPCCRKFIRVLVIYYKTAWKWVLAGASLKLPCCTRSWWQLIARAIRMHCCSMDYSYILSQFSPDTECFIQSRTISHCLLSRDKTILHSIARTMIQIYSRRQFNIQNSSRHWGQ